MLDHPIALVLLLVGLILVWTWQRTGDHRLLAGVGLVAGLAGLEYLGLLRQGPYLALGGTALVLGVLWLRWDERWCRTAFAVTAGLLALYFAFDRVRPETVARQMQRKTEGMAAAVGARDAEAIFRHVSGQFRSGRLDQAGLRRLADRVLESGALTEVVVWDFENPQVEEASARIDFKVKARGSQGERLFRCTARFVKDADGEWRLQQFRLFDWINGQEVPWQGY